MFKKTMFILGLLSFSSLATAATITNPFYLPNKMQINSTTYATFNRKQHKNSEYSLNTYNTLLQQEIQIGITDSFSLWGNFGNTFLKEKTSKNTDFHSFKKDKNLNWGAGIRWNILDKKFKLQTHLAYHQSDLPPTEGKYKFLDSKIKGGYQLKTMLPYIELTNQLPVGQKKHHNLDKPIYTAKIGLYQNPDDNWDLNTGLCIIHNKNNNIKSTLYDAEAELSHNLTQKSSISIYGAYTLSAKTKHKTDIYNKSIGLRFRWTF